VAGGDVDPALVVAISGSSTVEYVDAPRLTYGELGTGHDGRTAEITSLDPASLGRVVTVPMVSGRPDLRAGVLVPTDLADRLGISPGMTVTIALSESVTVSRPVAGVYRASQVVRGVLIDRATLPDDVGFVSYVLATGSDPAAVRAGLDQLAADRPDIVVLDHQGVIDDVLDPVRTALFLIYGLLAAAVLIAVFGVVNTLALAVIERTREIGVLRAVGALRSVVRRTVRVESVLIATYGGVLGVGVGLLVGAVMQHILTGTSIVDFTVPVATVVVALVGMVMVGVLAAVWPARRAARSDVLAAISVE
jgi:putative ABC transport system permease protein